MLGALVPGALERLRERHPDLEVSLLDTHPPEALDLLRAGRIDVAIVFRYAETEPEPSGVRLHHLLDDPLYVLAPRRVRKLATLRDEPWIAGCERCRSHLLALCRDEGFEPEIRYTSDDMVVMQALVAAGLGRHHHPGPRAAGAPGRRPGRQRGRPARVRQVYAATYGEPPDPPATAALLAALAEAGEAGGQWLAVASRAANVTSTNPVTRSIRAFTLGRRNQRPSRSTTSA